MNIKSITVLLCIIMIQGCFNITQEKEISSQPSTAKKVVSSRSSTKLSSSEKRLKIDSPEHLVLQGKINLVLTKKTSGDILKLSGTKMAIDGTQVVERGSTVDIINSEAAKPITVVVHAGELESVQFIGDGNIVIDDLTTEVFDFDISTNSKMTISDPVNIRYLQLSGDGEVCFTKLMSSYLSLNMKDKIVAKLQGKIKLNHLNMKDNSWLEAYWVETPFLRIVNFDKSFAKISGVVKTLDVNLKDSARFSGKDLRATKAYVKTSDSSKAEIFAKEVRNTHATDQSNIYNYQDTKMKADRLSDQSSIFSMKNM